MADQPTIDIEEIARALFESQRGEDDDTWDDLPDFHEGWRDVAREHLRRVREVVERMPCRIEASFTGSEFRHQQRCERCAEIAAIDAVLTAGAIK